MTPEANEATPAPKLFLPPRPEPKFMSVGAHVVRIDDVVHVEFSSRRLWKPDDLATVYLRNGHVLLFEGDDARDLKGFFKA